MEPKGNEHGTLAADREGIKSSPPQTNRRPSHYRAWLLATEAYLIVDFITVGESSILNIIGYSLRLFFTQGIFSVLTVLDISCL